MYSGSCCHGGTWSIGFMSWVTPEGSAGATHLCRVPWGSGTLNVIPSSFCLPLLSLCYETPTFFIA